MPKPTFSNIVKGDVVEVIFYEGESETCEFLGFTDNDTKYSETPVFSTLEELKLTKLANNYRELIALQEEKQYGHHFYAVFKDLKDGTQWSAYLHGSGWAFGTSADPIRLASVNQG